MSERKEVPGPDDPRASARAHVEALDAGEELRRLRHELEASRRRCDELFALAPVGYLELGPRAVLAANETAERLLGVAPGGLVGLRFERFLAPESATAFRLHRRAVLESLERVTGEVTILAWSGRSRELRLESRRTSEAGEEWRAALIDVSEQRRLERELSQATRSEIPTRPSAADARVMVVAERDFVRVAARRSLEKSGYPALLVETVERALALLAADPAGVALLVSDASFSGTTGVELVERARALVPALPAVLMFGDDSVELDSKESRLPSSIELVRKPFRADELVACVRRALLPSPLVIVVEDDPAARARHQEILAREGYRVLIARTGREALEVCAACADEVSVVTSDFNLPDMDGGTLIEVLRQRRPELPIVFATQRSRHDSALERALSEPGVDLVSKPVDAGAFSRAVRSSIPAP